MLLLLNLTFFAPIQAQTSSNSTTIIDPKNPGTSIPLSNKEFQESVLLIQDLTSFKGKPASTKLIVTAQLINFRQDRKFLPTYTINGIGYNDDGKHNDQVAGDGIFTSVKKVGYSGTESGKKKHYVNAANFKYSDALQNYYAQNKVNTSNKNVSFSCKIRTYTCPEEHWWDSCWPLASPCTCTEFYDCEFSISLF